jgi:hypothetical protein
MMDRERDTRTDDLRTEPNRDPLARETVRKPEGETMMNAAAAAGRVIGAYNAKDFDTMESLIAEQVDFAHFNRNYAISSRSELVAILRQFASEFLSSRRFEEPERVTASGNVCVREGYWTAITKVDLAAFGASAGDTVRLKFATVMRFDDEAILLEWKDYG